MHYWKWNQFFNILLRIWSILYFGMLLSNDKWNPDNKFLFLAAVLNNSIVISVAKITNILAWKENNKKKTVCGFFHLQVFAKPRCHQIEFISCVSIFTYMISHNVYVYGTRNIYRNFSILCGIRKKKLRRNVWELFCCTHTNYGGSLEEWDFLLARVEFEDICFSIFFYSIFLCVHSSVKCQHWANNILYSFVCFFFNFFFFLFYFFFSLLIYGVVFTLGNLFVFQIRMFVKKREQANGNLIPTWKSIIGLRPFANFNFVSVLYFEWRWCIKKKIRIKKNATFFCIRIKLSMQRAEYLNFPFDVLQLFAYYWYHMFCLRKSIWIAGI